MRQKRSVSGFRAGLRRKRIIQKLLFGAIIIVILSLIPVVYLKLKNQTDHERKDLRDYFEEGAFDTAYIQSGEMLKEKPLDFFLLTVHGFSAFELAIAQINNFDTIAYLDNCIWSLRKALLFRENSPDGRIFYVLGKAYFYKGPGYGDLAVNYLEKSRTALYMAADIPEYLGMAYAAIRDYRSSVAAFSLALSGDSSGSSDVLLLSIARSYLALEEYEPARAYLIRCLETSRNSRNVAAARLLLGGILVKDGDIPGAEAEYLKVIEETGDNAEAYYQLGEIYALGGDTTRARAEWRRAFRIDPTHEPARRRLNQ